MLKTLTLCIVLILKGLSTFAQNAGSVDTIKYSNFYFYFAGMTAIPPRDFREVISNSFGNAGYGINTGFLLSPFGAKKPSPVLVGLDFGYTHFGIDKIPATATLPNLKTSNDMFPATGLYLSSYALKYPF